MYPGRIAPHLQKRGWEVYGLTLRGARVEEALRRHGCNVKTFRSRWLSLLNIWQVLSYIRRNDIHIVHCHKSSDMQIGALVVLFRPDIRLFFTDHMGVKKPKSDWYHRWVYNRTARVFSISKATYQWNRYSLPVTKEKLTQLYYGVDLEAYTAPLADQKVRQIRADLGIRPGAVAIVLPGRIDRSKGHHIWLDALRELSYKEGLPDWQGIILGGVDPQDAHSSDYFDELKRFVDNSGLDGEVIFGGFRDDLAMCLRGADIACIPSACEAFGLAVIESMASGCAVVGSASGAIPELLGEDRGLTVEPSDRSAWATALESLLRDQRKRNSLSSNGAAWVRENFSMDTHVNRLTDYYLGISGCESREQLVIESGR